MKRLKDILTDVKIVELVGSPDLSLSAIRIDSRNVTKGDLFIAISGTQVNGHDYITLAIEQGAIAIVCEIIPEVINQSITYIKVNDSSKALGIISSNFYNRPSENIALIGITGTNGKTTTVSQLYYLFKNLGYKVGLISTIKYIINDKEYPSTHTTPEAISLNALLKQMVDEACEYCFMEVSSHAVVQNRIAGLEFRGAIFSNITHDHLDYHKTFDEYIKAKKGFFDSLSPSSFALVNKDDRNGLIMVQNTAAAKYTYGLKNLADFKGKVIEDHLDGQLLQFDGTEIWSKLIGSFNAYNLLAIYATALLLGEEKLAVLTEISKLTSIEGRFEVIRSNDGRIGIVDYAHTPDALLNVVNTINQLRTGAESLITVIGCGGNRDSAKRPIMAKIAAENSDKAIFTSDNPRNEEPQSILDQMQKGVDPSTIRKVLTIENRKEAIRTAYMISEPGDVILVAGKGHEKYQEVKGVKYPFDDVKILMELFND